MRRVTSHPIAFLFAVRWLAWLIALVGVAAGEGTAEHGVSLAVLLALTAVELVAETVLGQHRAFRPPLAPEARRVLLGVAAAGCAVGLVVVYLSGGWSSPFYHYAVMALLVPSFTQRLGPALIWGGTFVAGYLTLTLMHAGYESGLVDLLGGHAGTLATPLLVVLVTRYLAQLIGALSRERERSERAFREADALYRVSEAAIAHLADIEALLGAIVEGARETGLFQAMRVQIAAGDGEERITRGFGEEGQQKGPASTVSLNVAGEAMGSLTLLMTGEAGDGAAPPPDRSSFVAAFARAVALGVHDARLFAQRQALATQAERVRIAREIHDGMAQSLYMLSLGLEACADAAEAEQGELGRRLEALAGVSRQALWEARRYIFDLTPPVAGEHSLVAMLENLTREFEAAGRVPTTFTVEGTPRSLPHELSAGLYRIGQEALANTFKHAQAGRAGLTLAFLPEAIRLTVEDDGRGMARDGDRGHGLDNMRTRAEGLGGACVIESAPGCGTRVRVDIPTDGGSPS